MIKLFCALLFIMCVITYIFYYYESIVNPDLTLLDSIWWCFVTLTTVGYGDFYPVTFVGRLVASILMICGIGSFGLISATVTSYFVERSMKRGMGLVSVKCQDHFVIFGWNSKTKHFLDELQKDNQRRHIVIVANEDLLEFKDPHIHYVKGDATDDETLKKANVSNCHTAIVLADESLSEVSIQDSRSVLICLALDKMNPHIHIVCEVMDKRNVPHFKRANVDDLIVTNEINSKIILRSALSKRISDTFSELLTNSYGNELHEMTLTSKEAGKSFIEALTDFASKGQGIILGIHRDGKTMLNPDHNLELQSGDVLIYMHHSNTR